MRDSSLMALAVPSLDGDPDRLAPVLGLHDFLLQLVEPFTAIEHFADFSVLAYEDAALGVFGGVAGMDADALPLAVEIGATEQDGEPLLELWLIGDDHGIAAFGDGRAAFHLVGPHARSRAMWVPVCRRNNGLRSWAGIRPSPARGCTDVLSCRSCALQCVSVLEMTMTK